MKLIQKILINIFVFGFILTNVSSIQARVMALSMNARLSAVGEMSPDGRLQLMLSVSHKEVFHELEVKIYEVKNIIIDGPKTWKIEDLSTDSTTCFFDVIIPDNKNSCITIQVKGSDPMVMPGQFRLFFDRTSDTLEVFSHGPIYKDNSHNTSKQEEIDFDTLSQIELNKEYVISVDLSNKKYHKNIIEAIGYTPELDDRKHAKITLKLSKIIQMAKEIDFGCKFFEPADWMPEGSKVPDDYTYPYKDTTKNVILRTTNFDDPHSENDIERMHRLEKHALTNAPMQSISVNGEHWIRYRGKTKFNKVEPIDPVKRAKEVKNIMDSINALPKDAELDIGLDLRRSENYSTAESVVDSLILSTEPGHYFTRTNKEVISKLKELGINVNLLDTIPHSRSFWPNYNSDEIQKEPDTSDQQGLIYNKENKTSEYVWRNLFGSNWRDHWGNYDESWGCGSAWWDNVSGWGVWCAEGGYTCSHPGQYDCSMYAYIISEAIDLSGFGYVSVESELWLDIEEYDYLYFKYSYDGNYWFPQTITYQGNSGGWFIETFDVPNNYGFLYIKYIFSSDGIAPDTERGAYIKEVAVIGEPIVYPNLQCHIPNGWDDQIVVSSDSGANTNSTVYAGEPIFIDWAGKQFGDDTLSFNIVQVIDDEIIDTFFVYGLLPDQIFVYQDYEITLDEGWHTVRVVIDSAGYVTESDETDNWCEKDFYVESPSVTYSGILYFQDLKSPLDILLMKNTRIEMWDDDSPLSDDSLDYCITDEFGRFQLGPINNTDQWNTLDIYFKIFAENEAVFVTKDYSDNVYFIKSPNIDDIASGVYDTTILADGEQSGFFFMADCILNGHNKWLEISDDTISKLRITGVEDTLTAYGINPYPTIYISTYDYYLSWYPDQFDEDVILEEYGHHIAYDKGFFNDCDGQAYWTAYNMPLNITACESWTLFWSSFSRNSRYHRNYAMNADSLYTMYNYWDLENGGYGQFAGDSSFGTMNNYGTGCIGSVSGILWDICDFEDMLEDYSTYDYFPSFPPYNNPDGIGDTLSNGIANIMDVLLNRTVNGHHPDNIDEFWEAWFENGNLLGHGNAMQDIWYEHGEIMSCCILRGDVAIPKDGIVLVNDIVWMVNYLFKGGTSPECEDEADVNNDDVVNVADIVYLVEFLFRGGPALVPCQ